MSRHRGRPRKEPGERLDVRTVKLAPGEIDAVCQIALRHGVTVHAVLRLAVRRLVRDLGISGSSENTEGPIPS